MAELKTVTYESIMRDLRAHHFLPLYYLQGEESYYIDKIAEFIAENILRPEERDFNLTVLYGSDVTSTQIVEAARRYPMMSEYQVVIVKEAQSIKNFDPLKKYFSAPLKSTILVICHKNGKLDERKKDLIQTIKKIGVLFESKKLRDRELPSFIESYLKQKGTSIDPKSSQIIADSIGSDLNRMVGELDKILLSLPENDKRITPAVVEEQIGVSKEFNAFEFRDALVNKNIFKANQIFNYFDNNPRSGGVYALLPITFKFFQNLMTAYYAPNSSSPESVAKWLELKNTWGANIYVTAMRNYTGTKVLQIIYKIREIDAKSKGLDNPNTSPSDLMKELIYFILH